MSSVAYPAGRPGGSARLPAASAATPPQGTAAVFGAEADLIRRAARSDEAAFNELYRRHAQTAWRLAQAVSSTTGDAAASVADGYSRVLRGVRRRRVSASDPFRPLVLSGVYCAAMDRVRRREQTPAASGGSDGGSQLGLAGAVYRSLPERWRAALWLTEVEGLTADQMAPVLGVSAAVAAQLAGRGRRAMADRYRQAGSDMPRPLGPELKPLAAGVPAGLAAMAVESWRSSVAGDATGRLVPSVGWLGEHAVAPLRLAAVGILALGVVSVGVISQRGGLSGTGPVAAGGPPGASSRALVEGGGGTYLPSAAAFGPSLLFGQGGTAGSGFTAGGFDLTGSSATSGGSAGASATGASASTGPGSPGGSSSGGGGSSGGGSSGGGGSGGGGSHSTPPITSGGGAGVTTTVPTATPVTAPAGISVSASPSSGVQAQVPNPVTSTTTTTPLVQVTLAAPNCLLSGNVVGIEVGQSCVPNTTTTSTTQPPITVTLPGL